MTQIPGNLQAKLQTSGLRAPQASEPVAAANSAEPIDRIEESGSAKSGTEFSFNPQDPKVMATGTTVIKNVHQGAAGPETNRIRLADQLQPVDRAYVYPDGDDRQAKAQAFSAVARTVELFSDAYGDFPFQFSDKPLTIFGDGGKQLNGRYRREQKAIIFYHSNDPKMGTIYTGASNDVAAHETGHAILDGIRPNYYTSLTPEPCAFHEAFGDMMSIHTSLADVRVLDQVVAQTGGDLKKPNIAALIAEQMGVASNTEDGFNGTGGDYLRDANNVFTYTDPFKLIEKGPLTELHSNRHNFSRVWTGAHYDLLALMTKQKMDSQMEPKQAIAEANSELLKMLANMLKEAPQADFTFPQMAEAFLKSDAKYAEGKHLELIREAFSGRQIIPADFPLPERSTIQASESRTNGAKKLTFMDRMRDLLESTGLIDAPKAPEAPHAENSRIQLDESFGSLQGAQFEISLEAGLNPDESKATRDRSLASLRNLIKNDRVLPLERNGELQSNDHLTNSRGESYAAAVFPEGDQQIIRAIAMNICEFHQHDDQGQQGFIAS